MAIGGVKRLGPRVAAFAIAAFAFSSAWSASGSVVMAADSLCAIVSPSSGIIAPDARSVTDTVPTIMSSAAAAAPFSFTVRNLAASGIDVAIAASPMLSTPFSYLPLTPGAAFFLAAGGSQTIGAGIRWSQLSNIDLGTSRTMTWTISCALVMSPTPPPTPVSATPSPSGTVAGATSRPTATPQRPSNRPTGSVAGATTPPRPFVSLPPTDTLPGEPIIRQIGTHWFAILLLLTGITCLALFIVVRRRRRKPHGDGILPGEPPLIG